MDRAAREARSPDEQGQVAFAREREIERAGRIVELNALHAQWKRPDDSCLQHAATRREQVLELMATAPATSLPDSPRP